jgi:hypothetical protein
LFAGQQFMLHRNENWYNCSVSFPVQNGKKFAAVEGEASTKRFQSLSLDDGQGPESWKPLMAKLWYTNSVESRIRP